MPLPLPVGYGAPISGLPEIGIIKAQVG